jgi:PhoH-like ATPase
MNENEYLLITDEDGNKVDTLRWNGKELVNLRYKRLDNRYTDAVKPRNFRQEIMFDMLQNKDITVKATFGGFGTGKDYVMISHAVNMIEQGIYDKLIWVRNNVEVKDSNPIGFLPDGLESKLMPFAAPLADHVGGMEGLTMLMKQEKIEIQHLGFMRGRDIKNAIIYVTEVQNNTSEHIKLLIGRVGEGSTLWVNGDLKQADSDKFAFNSAINTLSKLKGNGLYGQVTLDKVERSKTASLADLI